MLLLVGTADKIQVVTSAARTVDVHASYMDSDSATNPATITPGRKNTAIVTAATTDVSGSPGNATTTRNVKTLNIRNKHASAVDVTVQHTDGSTTVELHKTTLGSGEALGYVEGIGFVELGTAFPVGGLGTPSGGQTPAAGSASVVTGTLFQLPSNTLQIGSRFRFNLNIIKTAAGVATWTVAVKYGTAGTNADAAIASFISGTNTAAIDQANLHLEVIVASLGATASATVVAIYSNTLTNVTGLGSIAQTPTSGAAFDSTAALPFMHVDITPGASAAFTVAGTAERLA